MQRNRFFQEFKEQDPKNKDTGMSKSSTAFIKRGNFQDNMDSNESRHCINHIYYLIEDSQNSIAVRRVGKWG